jgi:tetratricopeptide (TPR) repeat protein
LSAFRALDATLEPGVRLGLALKQAGASYAALPESERVYQVPEAIRGLLHYAVAAIAIGTRTQDSSLLEALPGLLAPFAATSPIVHAIWQNVTATCESGCWAQPDLARERWLEVLRRLNEVDSGDMHRIEVVRQAVAYGIASMSAYIGLASATEWAERVERDPRQRVNALYLRRVIALQAGDANEAEAFRRKAEIAALQASTRQMFANSGAELPALVAARDLAGVRQIGARLLPLAQRWPGWRAYHHCAEGYFELLRGDYAAAQVAFGHARELGDPASPKPERNIGAWLSASAGLVETLVGQGQHAQARELGLAVLSFCEERRIRASAFAVVRALAVAEAKLADFESASARLDALIATQEALGVKGAYLGVSYEARARVAIAASSWDDVGKYAALAAREYRHGKGSLLAGRYERLMDEVRKALRRSVPMHTELALISSVYGAFPASATQAVVTSAFSGQLTATDRAGAALALMCEHSEAAIGHLFLNSENGFILAASHGAIARSTLVSKVRAYLIEQQTDNELVTETVHGLDARFLVDGVQYTALPLACSLSGHVCAVGVVVLASCSEKPLIELDPSLLEGVALKLLQLGDAVSVSSQRISQR